MNKFKEMCKKIWDTLKRFYQENKNSVINPTLVLICICLITTLALSVSNAVTAPTINKNTNKQTEEAMKSVLKADTYKKCTVKTEDGKIDYHLAIKEKKEIGYIFTITEGGYGGDISVMVALNLDCTVKTVNILDASNETPGLGQNVKNKDFYSQFEGKGNNIKVVKKGTKSAQNEIEAITSATISSTAVTNAVKRAISYADCITGGGNEKNES